MRWDTGNQSWASHTGSGGVGGTGCVTQERTGSEKNPPSKAKWLQPQLTHLSYFCSSRQHHVSKNLKLGQPGWDAQRGPQTYCVLGRYSKDMGSALGLGVMD